MRVGEVGCGNGNWLAWFAFLGAPLESLYGIDLSPTAVEEARLRLPFARVELGSADAKGLPDASLDIVTQFSTFSSVSDGQLRQAIAAEMDRVP